ncbi:MAG: hypothetical protein LBL28_05310 [Treponema sp.]|jgi:hypothetical protein|nr:hypothetical protein [Treponema sp.]
MPDLTEEEYDALDEKWTKTTPKVSGNGKNGFFVKYKGNIVIINDISAAWLRARADAAHKTPSEIIDDMVWEQINTEPAMDKTLVTGAKTQ